MDYSVNEGLTNELFEKIKGWILPSENNNFKSKFIESNLVLGFVVLLLAMKIFASLISLDIPKNIFFADITKSALENFVNQTRQSYGLGILTENEKLDEAAQLKAQNMVQNQYFDHTSPSGISPWHWFSVAGYNYKYAGENLAIGFFDSKEVFQAWLNSPSHKANIVNPNYKEVGTAVLGGFGGNNTFVVVQEFGSPTNAKLVAKNFNNSNLKPIAKIALKPITTAQQAQVKVKTTEPSSTVVAEKVLATESQVSIGPNNGGSKTINSGIFNYLMYNYYNLLQDLIFGASLIMIGILFALISFSFNFQLKRGLVIRAVLIMVLLSTAAFINKDIVISLIPHQVII